MISADQAGEAGEDAGRRHAFLQSIREMVEAGDSGESVIGVAADGLRDLTELDHVLVIVRDHGGDTLAIRHASLGTWEREQIYDYAGANLEEMRISGDALPLLQQIKELGPVIIIERSSRIAALASALPARDDLASLAASAVRSHNVGCACVVPLYPDGELGGAIIATRYGPQVPPLEDLELLRMVAELTSSAVASN